MEFVCHYLFEHNDAGASQKKFNGLNVSIITFQEYSLSNSFQSR